MSLFVAEDEAIGGLQDFGDFLISRTTMTGKLKRKHTVARFNRKNGPADMPGLGSNASRVKTYDLTFLMMMTIC